MITTKLFDRSGPCSNCPFIELPWNFAAASNTILTFPSILVFIRVYYRMVRKVERDITLGCCLLFGELPNVIDNRSILCS